jgi:Pyruvate/2-oxoacid:ferredoxin oxidoreductase gamma subunit
MERELLFTGIGGQGIQLATKVLAHAGMIDGLEVQLFGSYGGMMRGGNTDTTLVMGEGPVTSPPTVSHAWAAVVMHDAHAAPSVQRVRDGGLVFANADVVPEGLVSGLAPRAREVRIAATEVAIEMGDIVAATMVMVGALASATELVGVDSLCAAVRRCLPPYRQELADLDERAIRAGAETAPADAPSAWRPEVAAP